MNTTAEAIAERIGVPPDALAYVLADERERGHVRRSPDGRWSIVREAFDAGTIEALAGLALGG